MSKNDNNNKNDNGIVSGIILIVIGFVALMVTFFDVEIVWSELAKLWPVFIIIFGISILPLNKLLKAILVIISIIISLFLYYNGVKDDDAFKDVHTYNSVTDDVDVQEFSEPYRNNISEADVEIDYGAGTLFLNPPVDDLVKASNASNYIVQDFTVKYQDNKADIIFDLMKDNISVSGKDAISKNLFNLALNDKPVYDFEINVGAVDMNFDFSDYKISNLELNGGACDIDMRFGDLHDFTEVAVNTGVSDIKIGVPTNSACRVECESVLSSKKLDGFNKKSSGVYETPNYSSANNVINIEITGAISDFEIYRY